jgi:hypothetical protein
MVVELTGKNFTPNREVLLCTANPQGNTLVYFSQTGCSGCNKFSPVFQALENALGSYLMFAEIDLKKHQAVLLNSRKTAKTPIPYTPYLIFYKGSAPAAKYKGELTYQSVNSFIGKVLDITSGGSTNSTAPQSYQSQAVVPSDLSQYNQSSRRARPTTRSGYAVMGGCEEDEHGRLMCPTNVIPHNAPWSAGGYRKMGDGTN